jgi:hypothetical protein
MKQTTSLPKVKQRYLWTSLIMDHAMKTYGGVEV